MKGLEIAAYDPRAAWGQGLNYAVANRGGCHLSAYLVSLEIFFGFLHPYTTRSKAFWVDFFEDLNAGINSLQTCQFTSFAYILEPVIAKYTPKFMLGLTMQYLPTIAAMFFDYSVYSSTYESITGIPMTMRNFHKAGRRTHILERYMNIQMGITAKDDTLPNRFLNEAETNHPVKKVIDLEPMIKAYYKKKGYDHNGIPTPATLKELDII